ncbi:hypothetical protein B0H67DRAFT_571698 [Lasiosphaeris hirsuta]|uniref:Zn(2)-C6 fungal-type domain-containing protein n=1 Tax=Lasiosphaeris hirsuta TaxID=260670 RepID=A0AA40E5J6_9PEZI|nr:hypothetical protein B0H67DRAFT_571698 [Lasiosphaeris hirsuta]
MTRIRTAPDPAAMSAFTAMSAEQQKILEQAAALLNLPLTALLRQQEQAVPVIPATSIAQDGASTTASSRLQELAGGDDPAVHHYDPPTEAGPFTGLGASQYEYMVPWASADASHYRDRDYLDIQNRNLNGFVPSGNSQKWAVPEKQGASSPRSAPSANTQTHANKESSTGTDPDAVDLSALIAPSPISGSPSGRLPMPGSVREMTETSDGSMTVGNTPASEWSSQLISEAGTSSYDFPPPPATSTELSPVMFVPCNPQEPVAMSRQKRGPFQNDQLREETNKTRQLKACLRCRMQKTRCIIDEDDPSGTCITCQNVGMIQKIHNLPCLRYRLTECTEFRVGKAPGMEYSARWPVMKLKDISKWASNEIRTITVKSDVSPVPFDLKVRKFVPIPQDSLHRAWMDGKTKKFLETQPYAIADMRSTLTSLRHYITKNIFNCIEYFLKNADELVRITFSYAREYMSQRADSEDEATLLANYMKLWVAVRRTATFEHIISQDTLDMVPETEDKSFPFLGKVPLPPVLIQQLDIILHVGILMPLQKQVLEDMQKLIISNNPRTWMTMYLTTFMSLQSCASLSAENYRNARRQGFRRRYSFPSFILDRHNAANVFLSHYHYRTAHCNPFKIDWKRRHATPFADMSTEDIIFLQKTAGLLEEPGRAETIRHVRENELYESDFYFVSQMYEDNWQPRDSRIDFDGGTVHGGPVKKYYAEPPKE